MIITNHSPFIKSIVKTIICDLRFRLQLQFFSRYVWSMDHKMIAKLRDIRPEYRLRLKGLSFWTTKPRPVLLQASTLQ